MRKNLRTSTSRLAEHRWGLKRPDRLRDTGRIDELGRLDNRLEFALRTRGKRVEDNVDSRLFTACDTRLGDVAGLLLQLQECLLDGDVERTSQRRRDLLQLLSRVLQPQ